MKNKPKNKKRKIIIPIIIQIVLIIITVIVTIIVGEKWNDYKEAQKRAAAKPYVAVIISNKAIDFEIPEDFIDGFEKAKSKVKEGYLLSKNDQEVDIAYKEDFLSEQETAQVAEKLASDSNCILVVGNANSTLTNINLDSFISSKTGIPFIMPIATDNNLIKKAEAAKYDTILQMLPNNGRQASTIERLVSKFALNRKVAVYSDEENQSYSINLCRDISERVRKKGGTIVIEEMIGPRNSFYTSSYRWGIPKGRPEIIVYVGVSHHGLLLLDQVSSLDISIPIVFTDGCLVTSLLSNSSKYSSRSFILSPAEFKEEDLFLPSYKSIGEDAFFLVSKIIKATDGTREGVKKYLKDNKKELAFAGSAGKYGFNPYGENEDRDYFVYEMRGGKLVRFTNF